MELIYCDNGVNYNNNNDNNNNNDSDDDCDKDSDDDDWSCLWYRLWWIISSPCISVMSQEQQQQLIDHLQAVVWIEWEEATDDDDEWRAYLLSQAWTC